jgi:hypothetical protein
MVFRGVVAVVSILAGRKVMGEELRFIPLSRGESMLAEGDKRLRVTRARKGELDPEVLERDLRQYAGRVVAADATEYDDQWLYGCVDMSQHQP